MRSNAKRGFGLLLALSLVGLVGVLCWQNLERVSRQVDLPLRGEASYNPLYGLKRALEQAGLQVSARADLSLSTLNLGRRDTLVLDGHIQRLSANDTKRLLAWVRAGGHLMITLPRAVARQDGDFDESEADEWVLSGSPSILLDALAVRVLPSAECAELSMGKPASTKRWCPRTRFLPLARAKIAWQWAGGDSEQGFVLGRGDYGDGSVTLASSFKLLASKKLREPDNQLLARQLFAPVLERGNAVHLIYGHSIAPIYVLLVRLGWPILLPLGLALVLMAFARSARLGPQLAYQVLNRRALVEHVQAAGEFAFRRLRAAALHQALRQHVMDKLQAQHPQLAGLDAPALVLALNQLFPLGEAVLRHALFPEALQRSQAFILAVRTLLALRNHP